MLEFDDDFKNQKIKGKETCDFFFGDRSKWISLTFWKLLLFGSNTAMKLEMIS